MASIIAQDAFVHELSVVEDGAQIGPETKIWRWSLVRGGAILGSKVKVGSWVIVGPYVKVGDRCKIEDGSKLYGPLELEAGVFIGPNVVISNDRLPRADVYDWQPPEKPTVICEGASVGSCAVIIPGLRIGRGAMIGAGAVVTEDVPDGETWVGVPARRMVSSL